MLAEVEKEVSVVETAIPTGLAEALLSLITLTNTIVASSTLVGSSSGTILAPQVAVTKRLIPLATETTITPLISSVEHAVIPDS